ncbi:Zn-ribbon domain-containing OB-fold protein [Rhodococcus rhodochrous]|uniref:Zn-ribbon domain-containing OB-fold protein n=1 Tax=Rhodococcus rhodochrous TaxID=1829 RepID=UPI0012FE0B58|nr:OB-fold domain-containing protein [Rhodococcus rhodochrous]
MSGHPESTTQVLSKPIPVPDEADLPYWDGLKDGRLVLCRCDNCGLLTQRLPMLCVSCRTEAFSWAEVSGRGSIYSFTIMRRSWVSGFGGFPYVVVAVAIEEQPSLVLITNLVGDFVIDDLEIGMPVTATYEERGDAALLQFRLGS